MAAPKSLSPTPELSNNLVSTPKFLPFPWVIDDDDVIEQAAMVSASSQNAILGLLLGNECNVVHIVPVTRLKKEPVHVLSVDFEFWIAPDLHNHLWASALDHIFYTSVGMIDDCPYTDLEFLIYHQSQVDPIPDTANKYVAHLTQHRASPWYGSILVMVRCPIGRFIPFKPEYIQYARLAVVNMIYSKSFDEESISLP